MVRHGSASGLSPGGGWPAHSNARERCASSRGRPGEPAAPPLLSVASIRGEGFCSANQPPAERIQSRWLTLPPAVPAAPVAAPGFTSNRRRHSWIGCDRTHTRAGQPSVGSSCPCVGRSWPTNVNDGAAPPFLPTGSRPRGIAS